LSAKAGLAVVLAVIVLAAAGSVALGRDDDEDNPHEKMSRGKSKAVGIDCHTHLPKPGEHAADYFLVDAPSENFLGCHGEYEHAGVAEHAGQPAAPLPGDENGKFACFTCHDPHKTGDFSLRVTSAAKLYNGETFDAGKGNLCSECHRARGDAAKTVVEMDAARISANFGAHHGPQADMVAGTNAFEYQGKTYSSSAHTTVVRDTCAACHMAPITVAPAVAEPVI
jgi:hypothetical protein